MANTESRKTPWKTEEYVPDLTGKVGVVTGANLPTGIGFHIAHNLALKGAKTYLSARSLIKAREAIQNIYDLSPNLKSSGLLLPLPMELSDLAEVKRVGEEFSRTEGRLDILVNNAALVPRELDFNDNGISLSFAVNQLALFILTKELLPLLKHTSKSNPGVRVVNVSSEAHAFLPPTVKFDSLADFNQELDSPMARYALSKLANILFTKELQRRMHEETISGVAVSVHPGNSATDGARKFLESVDKMEMLEHLATPLDAALTPLFAATSPIVWEEQEKYGGAYLIPFGILQEPSETARNQELAKNLWETSERVVEDALKGLGMRSAHAMRGDRF